MSKPNDDGAGCFAILLIMIALALIQSCNELQSINERLTEIKQTVERAR